MLKPTVFIGAAKENDDAVRILQEGLRSRAKIVRWNDEAFERAGHYFLDSLLAATDQYDFAIFVLGTEDMITSRGKKSRAPRDNVIFEMGLFMSKLGRDRTYIVLPRPWKSNLKVLSDLTNLTLHYYEPPKPKPRSKEALREVLEQELPKVIGQIREEMDDKGVRRVSASRGPEHVTRITQWIERYTSRRGSRKPLTIRNMALDMKITWSIYEDIFLRRDDGARPLHVMTMMMDHQSEAIRTASGNSPTAKEARSKEAAIVKFCREQEEELAKRNISFECRAYDAVPWMHGFLCGDEKLVISACRVVNGKLKGTPNPYLELDKGKDSARDPQAHHLITAFQEWFDFRWPHCRPIWPR